MIKNSIETILHSNPQKSPPMSTTREIVKIIQRKTLNLKYSPEESEKRCPLGKDANGAPLAAWRS